MTITSNIFNGEGGVLSPSVLVLPVKTPVNAVAASGVVTFTGAPLVHVANVNASGTATITGTPLSVANVDASGLITVAGTPLSVLNSYADGTITITGTPEVDHQLVIGAQTFVFKALRGGVGQITIDADNSVQGGNIETAVTADLATATAINVLGVVHLAATAPGTAGNALALTTNATGVAVSGSGTFANGVDAVTETLTVGAQTFTFKASGVALGDIVISAVPATQAANIVTSVARDLATVTAVQGGGADTHKITITAVAHGVAGNALALLQSATGITVSGSGTLANGTDAIVQNLVVGAQTFTFKASGTATGDIVISATPAVQAANIVTSITRDLATATAVQGTGGSTHVVTFTAVAAGTAGNALSLTTDATGVAVSGAGTLANGVDHVHETITIGTQEFVFVTLRSGVGSFEITVNADPTTQAANAKAAINADVANVTSDNAAGVLTVTAATKGVSGNLIVLSEVATETTVSSVTGGKLDGGINGTVGVINEIAADANYIYRAIAANTISDANWRRDTWGAVY